jgi:hypothetical protein
MRQNAIIDEHWWLMTCDSPDLNWARLRVYQDGSADIFDCDGRTTTFASTEAAERHLREDEYTLLEEVEPDEQAMLCSVWDDIFPPTAATDIELKRLMLQRVGDNQTS